MINETCINKIIHVILYVTAVKGIEFQTMGDRVFVVSI